MVSLKVVNYNKTKGLTYSNLTYLININYEHSLNIVNAIRRTIISKVPTLAFEPSIMEFTTNSSVFNNDQLRERFSQLPILNYDTNTYFINPISDYLEYIVNEFFESIIYNTNLIKYVINYFRLYDRVLHCEFLVILKNRSLSGFSLVMTNFL